MSPLPVLYPQHVQHTTRTVATSAKRSRLTYYGYAGPSSGHRIFVSAPAHDVTKSPGLPCHFRRCGEVAWAHLPCTVTFAL